MPELFDPSRFVIINGMAVERDVLGIAQEIQQRWPNLRVQYLDPDNVPDLLDAPFQIIERDKNGRDWIVAQVWKLDETVIYNLAARDSHAGFDVNDYLDRQEARRKKEQVDQWAESSESAKELAAAVYGTTKDTYEFTDELTGKKVRTHSRGDYEVLKEGELE